MMKMILLIILVIFASVNANGVGVKNRRANRLYERGQYEDALKLYDEALAADPADSKLKMNRGSALYRLEDFDAAEQAYLDALAGLPSKDKKTQADARYNLGNVRFRQGERFEAAGDVSSAQDRYSKALEDYVSTLKIRPDDRDAKWNLQLAHNRIELMEQMRQQSENGDEGDDGDQNQERDDQGDKDDKNQEQNNDRNNQSDQSDQDQNEEQDQQDRQPQDQQELDDRRNEAERLIEQFADDDENLNKPPPPPQRGRIRQPEKDW